MQFLENQGIEKEKFYKKTLIASSNFTGVGLKSEIGGDKITKVLLSYPQINANWLLTGEGDMLNTPHEKQYQAPALNTYAGDSNGDGYLVAVNVLKDEVRELQGKLISCMEERDNLKNRSN